MKTPCVDECPEWSAIIGCIASGEFGVEEDVGGILHALQWSNDYYLLRADFPSCKTLTHYVIFSTNVLSDVMLRESLVAHGRLVCL